ncbi:TonB family protein [Halomonas sp. MA07-2]|uniref:TonB family protein n=1 Tax=Halomonas sp. MA07-2 TaxID=3440841 RepID=UPI003EEA55F5
MKNVSMVVACVLASAVGAGASTYGVLSFLPWNEDSEISQSHATEVERLRHVEQELEQAHHDLETLRQEVAESRARNDISETVRQRQAEEHAQRQREVATLQAAEAARQRLGHAIAGNSAVVGNAQQGQEVAYAFINRVRREVEEAWVMPADAPNHQVAEVAVRLGPSGELFGASITRSSGDQATDRSALLAVEAAAPFSELQELPVGLQRDYRQFNLRFSPGDVR